MYQFAVLWVAFEMLPSRPRLRIKKNSKRSSMIWRAKIRRQAIVCCDFQFSDNFQIPDQLDPKSNPEDLLSRANREVEEEMVKLKVWSSLLTHSYVSDFVSKSDADLRARDIITLKEKARSLEKALKQMVANIHLVCARVDFPHTRRS